MSVLQERPAYTGQGMTDEEKAKRLAKREQRMRADMLKVYGACARSLRRLYLPPGHPKRHPDADRTWSEATMQTRAALHLAKTQQDNPNADVKELFGIIVLQARAKDPKQWELEAAKVDAAQKQKAIDAIAVPKEPSKVAK